MKTKLTLFLIAVSMVIFLKSYANVKEDDPLIAKSYMDKIIAELKLEQGNKFQDFKNSIAAEIKDLKNSYAKTTKASTDLKAQKSTDKFIALEIKKGETVIFTKASEFILRSGNAIVIDNTGNGIADLTIGKSIMNQKKIGLNHLFLVPRADERGIKATENSWIMIRGSFEII